MPHPRCPARQRSSLKRRPLPRSTRRPSVGRDTAPVPCWATRSRSKPSGELRGLRDRPRCPLRTGLGEVEHRPPPGCGVRSRRLIKAILCLQNKAIPPTVHYTSANPELHLENTPFVIANAYTPWSPTPRCGRSQFLRRRRHQCPRRRRGGARDRRPCRDSPRAAGAAAVRPYARVATGRQS